MLPVQLVNLALADALYPMALAWCSSDELAGRSVNHVMFNVGQLAATVSLFMRGLVSLL